MSERVTKSIIVQGDPAGLYRIWSKFESFPHFMKYIESVEHTGDDTSHWIMKGPLGMRVQWHAEMTRSEENKRIAWSTKDGEGTITTSGQVTFNPLPAGETEVVATVQYVAPAGKAGAAVAKLFSNPEARLEEDLRNFKAFAEGMYERTDA